MSVLKYKDPVTGEVKTVGSPQVDAYNKAEVDTKLANHTDKQLFSAAEIDALTRPGLPITDAERIAELEEALSMLLSGVTE